MKAKLKKLNHSLFNDDSIKLSGEKMKNLKGGNAAEATYVAANLTATHAGASGWVDTDNDGSGT
ncbi:natural product precursor [Mucilaginibacter sp. OK268]|uniref:hypothetical protein n=1 Tax=Mucilaginibacter sp. OK268 TaxID=1881048 RepID=UPI000881EB0C|nr:hypothetical protein [Mucilaginibacter sp. OK268]SDP99134.1 natural product precursor [Mucilaginibacter sp. OK268]